MSNNVYHFEQRTVIENGEVETQESVKLFKLPKEPPFVKTYISDISDLVGVPSGCKSLIYELIIRIGYDNKVHILKDTKEAISVVTGMKLKSIENCIKRLLDKCVMTRCARGVYMMNPDYFARGKWVDICRMKSAYLKLTIKYKNDGSKIIKGEVANRKRHE